MSTRITPNQREIIAAVDSATGQPVYPTATGRKLDVNATASLAGSALPIASATTAVGVAIVDSSGNQISSFGGGTQYTDAGTPPAHPIGTMPIFNNSGTWAAVSASQGLPVNIVAGGGSGGTSSNFSSAFPSAGTAIGATDGTNMQALKVDASNNLLVKVNTALPAGTNVIGHVITDTGSTTAVTGTVTISGTVTANAGTNLNTSALALESGGNLATIAGAVISQEATTSGVKGVTAFGAVTTNAPTYTTAKSDALSLDTSGLLRVSLKDTPVNTTAFKVDGSAVTQPISAASLPLPSGAATLAKQPALGTAGTASADVITVQGIASMTAIKTDGSGVTQPVSGTFWQATQPVSGTITASNTAGDIASGATDSGNPVKIGGVNRTTQPTLTDGQRGDLQMDTRANVKTVLYANNTSTTADFKADNADAVAVSATANKMTVGTRNTVFNGTTWDRMPGDTTGIKIQDGGNSITVDGTVTANAGTGNFTVVNGGTFAVQATLGAETTKVIGTVRTADGSGNLYTTNSTTYTAKFGQDVNILGTLGTAFSTAGKVDVKGADGDVFVRQATATNLKAQAEAYQGGTAVGSGNPLQVTLANTGANATAVKVDGSAVTQPVSIATLPTLASGTNQVGSVNLAPTTVGGWTAYFANAVTTTVTVSGSAGKFGGYMLINLNSAPAYLQVFDTTGAVTLGSTAPTFVIPIPANSTAANGLAANLELANGVNIANGIKVAVTTTANGASTVSTGLSGSIWYK